MEDKVMTSAEAADLKDFFHGEIAKLDQKFEQKFEGLNQKVEDLSQKVEQAVISMVKWVVGLFVGAIIVVTSVVGVYTNALISMQ